MLAIIEYTDTYGGEANYCWVQRAAIDCDGLTDRQVVARLKKKVGLQGVKCYKVADYGDGAGRWNILNRCQCFFITFSDLD